MWQWYIVIKASENGFKHLSLCIVPKLTGDHKVHTELYDHLNQVKVYFGVKTFPVRAMKRC